MMKKFEKLSAVRKSTYVIFLINHYDILVDKLNYKPVL